MRLGAYIQTCMQDPERQELRKERGLRIKQARRRKGITQEQLAELVGLESGFSVSRYECGRSAPDSHILGEIARHLEVSADWLLTGEQFEAKASPAGVA